MLNFGYSVMEINEEFLEFLEKCTRKEKEAWDDFVERYSRLIYNYIIRTLKKYYYFSNNEEVEEIYNRIFIALLDNNCRRLKNFRGKNERSFGAYLREISFHMTVDFLREQKSTVGLEVIQYKICEDDNYKYFDSYELKEIIKTIKNELPSRHKDIFRFLYEEELNLTEIAEIMKLKLNAVHQLKFRMINNLIKIARKKKLYDELKKFISDN